MAGRNDTTDDRNGAFLATKWTPSDAVKITTDYIHTDLRGIPDFGDLVFTAGLERFERPTVHHDRRRAVSEFRLRSRRVLRLRQPRLLSCSAGHRHIQYRDPRHAGPHCERQGQGLAVAQQLHRHNSEITDRDQSIVESLRSPPIRRAAIGHRHARQPVGSDLQIRYRTFQAHAVGRRRSLARKPHRSTNITG